MIIMELQSTMVIILFIHDWWGCSKMIQDLMNCHVNDALDHMNKSEHGTHSIIIYPDLDIFRELYSSYVHKQIKENNEIVLINPFYETADSVRQVLSEKHDGGMDDICKFEKEESLMIADALEEYLGDQPLIYVKKSLANYAKMGKNGVSVLADLGAYPHRSKYNDLVDYELSLPTKYDVQIKGFCLYHQKDFDKFSDEQKQKLIEHHGKALEIIHV
jgi:MEDS: MEthanogen/methylotroph, DcmR Sensory domain